MTADADLPAINLNAVDDAAETVATPLPPEWMIWAAAVERREDLRFRVTKGPERDRFHGALAQHAADGGALDWTEETLDFVSRLREGSDRPELHGQRRRWSRYKRRTEGTAGA